MKHIVPAITLDIILFVCLFVCFGHYYFYNVGKEDILLLP